MQTYLLDPLRHSYHESLDPVKTPTLCRRAGLTSTAVESSWNMMAHGDAREGKWRRNWRMQWVASALHTTSEHGVSSITTADAHTSAASSRLNWRPPRPDLNRLVHFAPKKRNLVSVRVPSHFKRSLRPVIWISERERTAHYIQQWYLVPSQISLACIVKISHHVFRITVGNESICFSHFRASCYEGSNPEETEWTAPESTAPRQAVSWYLYNVLLCD